MSDTAHDRLSKLPTELLVLIFQHSTDFSSLWSLIHTSSYLSSVFDAHACLIGNAILNTKVPSSTRALMQGVLSLWKGIFLCRTPEDQLYQFDWSEVPLLRSISGTSSEIRSLIKLAHYVHVHAHLCIEGCIQRCLQSSLGDRHYLKGFEIPTWTEEQRGILGFWRLVFLNQLRKESYKGLLRWPCHALDSLDNGIQYYYPDSIPCMLQIIMVLDYLRGYPKSERLLERSKIFNLPPILKEREFGWDCQPPPSWQAISQGQEPDENPREQITASDIVSNVVTEPSAEQLINEMECQLVDPSEQLEEEPRENLGEEQEEASSEQHSQEPSQELSLRNCQQSDENLSLRSRRIRWFGPQSSSSESEPNEFYFLSDEDSEGDDDDENEDSDDGESIVIRPTRCTLRDTSDTDSDEYEFPDRLRVIGGSISQYRECPVQDFGPDSTGEEEYLDLERASLGLQFWSSMVSNPEGGPGKYMHFKAYSRYGFLLWEEWRMIEFGLWSNKPIEDMSVYYQKWFRFLCPEDMALHKKFRYAWDEDWL